jgi:hypothetical protein
MCENDITYIENEIKLLENEIKNSSQPDFLLRPKREMLDKLKNKHAEIKSKDIQDSANQEKLDELVLNVVRGDLTDAGEFKSNVMLKKKEKLICSFENITLQEERVTKLKGMSHGLSIKITKGLWYRPSYHTGGAEVKVTPVDEGQFSITNKRVIYTGERKSLSYKVDDIVSMDHFMEGISINREKKQKTEYFTGFDNCSIVDNSININGLFIKAVISEVIQDSE